MITIDQAQTQSGNSAGWGETAAVRYRGMGFTPTFPVLTGIQFLRNKGGQGIKIYIDTADSDSIPLHAVGSEIYSFTVPNSSIVSGLFQTFVLPVPLIVTPGTQYCFYIAPWNTSTDSYQDDYQDGQWKNANVYAGGKPIVYSGGAWSVSDAGNLDMFFQTWGKKYIDNPVFERPIRPRAFAPGIAR